MSQYYIKDKSKNLKYPKVSRKKSGSSTKTQKIEDTLDVEFSNLIRDKGRCERCLTPIKGLECSHVISRNNQTLRWDIFNALCLCWECHRWWHEEPSESWEWFKRKYPGRAGYLQKAKRIKSYRTQEDYKEILEAIREQKLDKLVIPIELFLKL